MELGEEDEEPLALPQLLCLLLQPGAVGPQLRDGLLQAPLLPLLGVQQLLLGAAERH